MNSFAAGEGVIVRAKKGEPGIPARAEAAAQGPCLSLEPRGYVLGQLTRKPDGRKLILHLLNYNHQAAAENVRVRLDVSGLVRDLSRWELKVFSPDGAQPYLASLSQHRSVIEFTVSRIEHYAVVTFSDTVAP